MQSAERTTPASRHTLHVRRSWLCSQTLPPAHSLHEARMRLCSQTPAPWHSRQLRRSRLWWQMLEPPTSQALRAAVRARTATHAGVLFHGRAAAPHAGTAHAERAGWYRILCSGYAGAGARRSCSRHIACNGCGGAHAHRMRPRRSPCNGSAAGRAGKSTCCPAPPGPCPSAVVSVFDEAWSVWPLSPGRAQGASKATPPRRAKPGACGRALPGLCAHTVRRVSSARVTLKFAV